MTSRRCQPRPLWLAPMRRVERSGRPVTTFGHACDYRCSTQNDTERLNRPTNTLIPVTTYCSAFGPGSIFYFFAAKRPKNHLGGCPRGRIVWLAGYFCANKPLILCLRGICRVPNVPRGRRLLPPLWRWSLVMLLALTLQTSDPDHPKIGAI